MMVLCFCLLLGLIISPTLSQFGNCAWDYDFTLEGAQGYEIQCIDEERSYGYTPCMQYALCNGVRYQAVCFNRNMGTCLYYLADWDDGEQAPKYSRANGGTWTFYYEGQVTSECPDGIEFDINWICDELSVPFYLGSTCGFVDGDQCRHELNVRSAYACVEGPISDDSSSSDGLSIGSIILILEMVAIILYCVVGYVINVMRTEERDWGAVTTHTPQWRFWTYGLCAYTKAGCTVSYQYLSGKMGKDKEGDGGTDYTLDDDVDDY